MGNKHNIDDFSMVSQIVSLLKEMDFESQVHILETVMTWLKIPATTSASSTPLNISSGPLRTSPSETKENLDDVSTSSFSNKTEMSHLSISGAGTVGMPLQDVEREHIRRTLEATGHNRAEAANILKIGERTLYRKIKEYNL